nr:type II toxin-antitoxin system RelB/DinJ family antitoxin [Xenorhabdus thuongxuanensis]
MFDAVRLMLTRVTQEKALPFELLVPNETTIAAMREARIGNVTKAADLETLFRDLNADGTRLNTRASPSATINYKS